MFIPKWLFPKIGRPPVLIIQILVGFSLKSTIQRAIEVPPLWKPPYMGPVLMDCAMMSLSIPSTCGRETHAMA